MGLNPIFTVIIIFYNGQREAKRTLHTLTAKYQNIDPSLYKVLVLDSGSSQRLDEDMIKSFGDQFSYKYVATKHPSPIETLQIGLDLCNTPYIMVCIDGARMLSPGIFKKSLDVLKINENAFVTTTGFHIGKHHQNYSILEGYNQEVEDRLLQKINWKSNGYSLFQISSLYQDGYSFFSHLAESNCFLVKTDHMREISFNQGFISKGGGLINLSVFKDLIEIKKLQVYALIGEATFHQFHGGAASNISMAEHPVQEYRIEYRKIMGKEFISPHYNPIYFGDINENIISLKPKFDSFHIIKTCNYLIANDKQNLAIEILKEAIIDYPFQSSFLNKLNRILMRQGRLEEGLVFINSAIQITPQHPFLYLHRAKYYHKLEKWQEFKSDILESLKLQENNIGALLEVYNNNTLFEKTKEEAETQLIDSASNVTKISHLKKILSILINKGDFEKIDHILKMQNQIYVNNSEITFLRIHIEKKRKNIELLHTLLSQLYNQLSSNHSLPRKQKLRAIQLFINNEMYEFANYLMEDFKVDDTLSRETIIPLDSNKDLETKYQSLLTIFPKIKPKQGKRFIDFTTDSKHI